MKKKKVLISVIAVSLCVIIGVSAIFIFGCNKGGSKKPDSLVVMSEDLNGLFNPFFATSGADMEVVGMTQISMLSTDYTGSGDDLRATVAYGDNEAVVVKDYKIEYEDKFTTYTFVLKNGLKFSDGKPLTMNDVLFNMYMYLDPVYTGSSTMYSTDIVGLQAYRTQKSLSGDTDQDALLSTQATYRAQDRANELINLFKQVGGNGSTTYEASEAAMREAIKKHNVSAGYRNAVTNDKEITNAELQKQLLADYDNVLETFKEELNNDYESAKDSYTDVPYSEAQDPDGKGKGFDEITSFMYVEGFVTLEYEKKVVGGKETDDKSKIKRIIRNYSESAVKDRDSAISYVYDTKVSSELHYILEYYATAQTVKTDFMAKAKEVILHENLPEGKLAVESIEGIKSLGHSTDVTSVTITNKDKTNTYKVAKQYNEDGTVKNADEYAVLQIKINGVDPKAIWNFGFSVAPQHYYAPNQKVDIANNQFGVVWGSFEFMKNEVQSQRNVKVPMGAGPYVATDENDNENPDGNAFYRNYVVYFKSNPNFVLGEPKVKKLRYQVVSSTNALNVLNEGNVHFVTPQFTKQNAELIKGMSERGIRSTDSWQLGYGYIGINAGKVPNLNIRKAIMSAMDTSLALSYYSTSTAQKIDWPMSTVNWAYPKNADGTLNTNNGHDYTQYFKDPKGDKEVERNKAKAKIENYMSAAGVSAGHSSLRIKFTIAGSNLSEHPTYLTFKNAADLLNECGWVVEVVPDTQALVKLSTGSLAVWAAAWGSTIDPDMYQVYHKNSTATSTLAWGYREIKASPASYSKETVTLNELSDLIDAAREIDDEAKRSELYEKAMGKVLDLAIEMPVYQRKTLYAYNANVIKESTLPTVVNPYTSPLARIWEIELVD